MIEKIFNGKRSSFAVFVMLTSIIFTGTVSAATLSVNADGSMDYTSIQDAINAASADDTILVYSGTYYEQVVVGKQLILRGIDNGGGKPIINAGRTGIAVVLYAMYITFDGFTVTNGSRTWGSCEYGCPAGILINEVYRYNIVTNNTVFGNDGDGIYVNYGNDNTISNNIVFNNTEYGIYDSFLGGSGTVTGNTVSGNGRGGIFVRSKTVTNNIVTGNSGPGIFASIIISGLSGYPNTVTGNIVSGNSGDGIFIAYGTAGNNTISGNGGNGLAYSQRVLCRYGRCFYSSLSAATGNRISGNAGYAFSLSGGGFTIYNNYINNTLHVSSSGTGTWNTAKTEGTNIVGGPYLGGNYWGKPDGTGHSQTCTDADSDGICDSPYSLDGSNVDYLPLSTNLALDVTPPTTTITIFGTLGDNGWHISDVQVALTAADNEDGSGVAKTEYSFDGNNWNQYTAPFIITNEGATIVYYKSTDNAGNVESIKNQTVKIDKTPSQVIINTPANGGIYILNQSLNADWSATDSLSGIASATGTLPSGASVDTSIVGAKTFTVNAVDNASNTATQTVTYAIAYNFLGILPPIRTDNSSIFKLGRTVPIKFRITDANGNYVNTAVANVTYQFVTDGASGSVEIPVSTSAANEGNTFRYDNTDNLYIFNLGTEGMNTGTYQLNINLEDGTVHTVRISLR